MVNKLSNDETKKNKEIFKYLRDTGYIPTFEKVDKELGLKSRYSYKLASLNSDVSVKKIYTLALELLYNIPHTLFLMKK